jgi:hypothetical protein
MIPMLFLPLLWTAQGSNVLTKERVDTVGGYQVLHVYGTVYEMGRAHGRLLRAEIAAKARQLKVLQTNRRDSEERLAVIRKLWRKKLSPGSLDEVKGIAEGSGLPIQEVEDLQMESTFWIPIAVAVYGERTAGASPLIGQSFFTRDNQPILVVCHPRIRPPYLLITFAGRSGGLTGVNSKGLASIAIPILVAHPRQPRCPLGILVRDLLCHCETVREGIEFLKDKDQLDYGVMIQCKDSEVRIFELTQSQVSEHSSATIEWRTGFTHTGGDCLALTDYFLEPRLRDLNETGCFTADQGLEQIERHTVQVVRDVLQKIRTPVSAKALIETLGKADREIHGNWQVVLDPAGKSLWIGRREQVKGKQGGMVLQSFDLSKLLRD